MFPSQIAVISDTHNRLPDRLVDLLDAADEIWHLGDVCSPDTINPIRNLNTPLAVVKGNCDDFGIWPERLEFERHGYHFQLQHLPPRTTRNQVDAILYGHLHYPQQDNWQGARVLNPGAVTGPRNGSLSSIGWIRFYEQGGWTWEIEPL